ncbi:DNA internalization-related competence protein ComEC/Rec2 [Desulfovibrio sp.]
MNSAFSSAAAPGGSSPAPGLFAWQVLFLAFVLGLFSLEHPEAALGAPLLWLAARDLRARPLAAWLLLLAWALGLGYMALRAPDPVPETPAWMEKRGSVPLRGVVEEVQPRPCKRLVILLRDVACTVDGEPWRPSGMVAWTWEYPSARPRPGQEVEFSARPRPVRGFGNPGTWDWEGFWERRGVAWRVYTRGADESVVLGPEPPAGPGGLRLFLRGAVEALTPPTPGGAVVLAVTTGDRFLLDPATIELMRDAGLSHSLALSGLHLGFVAALGLGLAHLLGLLRPSLLLRLPRPKLAVLLAAPLVLGYAWLGQPAPSLLRAACMFASWGVLLLLDRERALLDGLFLALAAILVFDPLEVHELSLQLSAAAVAGIAVFLPPLWRLLPGRNQGAWLPLRWALGMLLVSLCANLAILPLQAWHFGAVSPNFLANLVWLPVLGLGVMPLGLAGLVLAPFLPGLAGACLAGAASLSDAVMGLLAWADGRGWLPLVLTLRPLWPELLGGALLLGCLPLVPRARRVPVRLLGLGLGLLFVPHLWIAASDAVGGTRLDLLDVGQGQAALIGLPGGRRVLVDGGGFNSPTFDVGSAVVAPALTWGRPPRLEAVLMSHPDTDHAQGLGAILRGFDVGFFASAAEPPEALLRAIEARGVPRRAVLAGDVLGLGRGLRLEVLHPEQDDPKRTNRDSLILRLTWDGRGLLVLPGDVDRVGLRQALGSGRDVRAEVLVLPHHGSKGSLLPRFIDAVGPSTALVSCGYLNGYGFPNGAVVDDLRERGVGLWSTARCGRLEVRWARPDAPGALELFRPEPPETSSSGLLP